MDDTPILEALGIPEQRITELAKHYEETINREYSAWLEGQGLGVGESQETQSSEKVETITIPEGDEELLKLLGYVGLPKSANDISNEARGLKKLSG